MSKARKLQTLDAPSGGRSPTKRHAQVCCFELAPRLGLRSKGYNSAHPRGPRNPLGNSGLSDAKGLGGLHLIAKMVNQLLDTVGHDCHH